jgi:hypothetical protein
MGDERTLLGLAAFMDHTDELDAAALTKGTRGPEPPLPHKGEPGR